MTQWQREYLEKVNHIQSVESKKEIAIKSCVDELLPYINEYKALARYSNDNDPLFGNDRCLSSDISTFIKMLQKEGHFSNLNELNLDILIGSYKCSLTNARFSSMDLANAIEKRNRNDNQFIWIGLIIIIIVGLPFLLINS